MADPKQDGGRGQRGADFFRDAVHRPRANKRSTLDWAGRHVDGDALEPEPKAEPEPKPKPRVIGAEAFRPVVEDIQRQRDRVDGAGGLDGHASRGGKPL